jgi:hypothetical protein
MSAFPATRASFVGEATFSGCIALCARSRSELEAWLPAGARLAEGASRVAFAFGTHSGSATRFAGFDLRLGIVYHELGVFVPGVIREGGSEPELYVARMYSSYYPAVWNGNTHYGFAKEHVEIHRLGALYCVLGPDRRTLLEARSEPTASWRLPARGAIASLDEVREIFALPVVGRLADGRLVRSHFHFEFGAARVRPADVAVEIAAILAPGVRPGTYADGASGSIEVQNMIWRLSWPEKR